MKVLMASFFDQAIALSQNGALGWLPPDPAYANMTGGRSWVIPWMEDDLSLASAEIWANRTLEWADQAAEMKAHCDGLLGLLCCVHLLHFSHLAFRFDCLYIKSLDGVLATRRRTW